MTKEGICIAGKPRKVVKVGGFKGREALIIHEICEGWQITMDHQ